MTDPLLDRIDPWDPDDTRLFGDEHICLDCNDEEATQDDGLCDPCRGYCYRCNGQGGWTVLIQDPVRGGTYTRDKWIDCPDCEARLVEEDERAHAKRKEETL